MNKIIALLILVFATVSAVKAQVPYFAGTVGDGRLYGYTSVKFRPGTNDGKFFWCSNTWLTINDGAKNTYMNWEYLGMNIPTTDKQSITPMIGAIHSWKFDQDVDLALGAYYSIKNWNIYLWGNDFFKSNPRVVIGVDFSF